MNNLVLATEEIISHVHYIRGQKVLLDYDLASLYEIESKRLNEAVKRNLDRFPLDFMFELNSQEYDFIKATRLNMNWRQFSKYSPKAFTEQGVAMLSGILNSQRAIQVNISIMRAFIQMRRLIETNKELLEKVHDLEKQTEARLSKQDGKIGEIFQAIKYLIQENSESKKKVGFV